MIRGRWRARLAALSLLALALTAAPSAASAAEGRQLYGYVQLDGANPLYFTVNLYRQNGEYVQYAGSTSPDGTGGFQLSNLDPAWQYYVELTSWDTDFHAGYYAGPGEPLVTNYRAATLVSTTDDGLVLVPARKLAIKGNVELAPGMEPSALYLTATRITDDPNLAEEIVQPLNTSSGPFEILEARPGSVYRLQIAPMYPYETGFYRAGARGLVAEEYASSYRGGELVSIKVGEALVPPNVISLNAPAGSGSPVVGNTLSVSTGTWDPASVTPSYQWLRDGVTISGATASSYSLKAADAGKRISVRVTGAASGFESTSVTTAPTAKVALAAAAKATKAPAVSGTARFGQTLRATTGTWDRSGATFSYQWLRAGSAIKGATSSSYKIQSADVGEAISVRVTAKIPGRVDGVATSKATARVAKGKTAVKASAKSVSAKRSPKVVVTVKSEGLSKPTGTVTVKYGKKSVTAKLKAGAKGKVTVSLPKLTKGSYKITASFTPDKTTGKSVASGKAKAITLTVK